MRRLTAFGSRDEETITLRTTALACALVGLVAAGLANAPLALGDASVTRDASEPPVTAVLLTFDGVRANEIFDGPDAAIDGAAAAATEAGPAMPFFVTELLPTGSFLGAPGRSGGLSLGNPLGTSLPSYQSLFTGRPTLCLNNQCTPPRSETLLARVRRERGLPREGVTMLATWPGLCPGLDAPAQVDATCGPADVRARWLARFADRDTARTPPDSTDAQVVELALARLGDDPLPALLYVALDEADGAGHTGDYAAYLALLARYDEWLRRLDGVIRAREAGGARIVWLITTDHGRGRGERWREHRWNVPGTNELWLFARGPGVAARGAVDAEQTYSLFDVRPTLEALLGLEPVSGLFHGEPIAEILVGDDAGAAASTAP